MLPLHGYDVGCVYYPIGPISSMEPIFPTLPFEEILVQCACSVFRIRRSLYTIYANALDYFGYQRLNGFRVCVFNNMPFHLPFAQLCWFDCLFCLAVVKLVLTLYFFSLETTQNCCKHASNFKTNKTEVAEKETSKIMI